MSTNNRTPEEVLSLEEMIANAVKGKDTSINPYVKVESGGSLKTKGNAGYAQTDLSEEELTSRIRFCVLVLNEVGKEVNQSNVNKLLGFSKNTQYVQKNNEKRFIEELFKDINNELQSPKNGEDPTIPEHMYNTMSSDFFGSLNITPNQLIYAQHLKPIFDTRLNYLINVTSKNVIGGNKNTITSDDLMTGLLWMVLDRMNFFHHSMSLKNTYTYCKHLNSVIKTIAYSGRIHSQNASFDYIFRADKQFRFIQLIERYDRYLSGIRSYKYRYTKTLESIMKHVVELFKKLTIAPSPKEVLESDIVITKDMLDKINTRDLYILFNQLDGYNEDLGYIIKNSSTIKDEYNSRVYSLFTSIKSDTRKALGFINYDISTCMQTIVGAFVDMKQYPRHKELIDDKYSFRRQLADELEVDINKVKEIISAADNGHKHKRIVGKSLLLKEYIDEAPLLVKEFTEKIYSMSPEKIEVAKVYANDLLKFIGKDKSGKRTYEKLGINPYSLFFFIWTQIEREIRHAMMSCFDGFVHEVHDAVYSKEEIDNEVLEKAVCNATGIVVNIEQ